MRVFKDNIHLFRKCKKTMLLFELFFKSVTAALFYPIFIGLFNLSLKVSNVKYLINGNLLRYLSNPVTLVFILFFILFLGIYLFFEKCCLNVIFEAGRISGTVNVHEVFLGGIGNFLDNFKKRHFSMLLYEIFLFPFTNVVLIAILLINLSLPERLVGVFGNRNGFYLILFMVFVVMYCIAMSQIFVDNFLLSDRMDIKQAAQNSVELLKGKGVITFLSIIGWNVFFGIAVAFIFVILSGIVILGVYILNLANIGIALYLTILKTAKIVITIVLLLISPPITFFFISDMFFRYNSDSEEMVCDMTRKLVMNHIPLRRKQKRNYVIITLVAVSFLLIYCIRASVENPFDRVELFQTPEITAHRGSSLLAPENTMAAFEQAVDDLSDYIELDVHLTKDGQVVVLHDTNLSRTAGLNKPIYLTNYDIVRNLDAGSHFSDEFAGERIPTLEEVLEEYSDRVKLNIEIKYNKNEDELASKVLELIDKYDCYDRCIITSSNYSVLKKVKQYDERIMTGYTISIAYGKFYNIPEVDVISINYNYVNKNIVDAIHSAGKELYVWTVNSESKIRTLANMGVDNIITDNPVLAREVVYSRYTVKEIKSILDYIFKGK